MRDADFWQDLDRTDSASVALLGGLLAFVAVRGGTLTTELLRSLTPPDGLLSSHAALVLLAFAATFVLSVVAAAAGACLALWGGRRVLAPLVGRVDERSVAGSSPS